MRTGAALEVPAAALTGAPMELSGRNDSNAGSARQAPSPRRKRRRLRLAKRSAARFRFCKGFVFMVVIQFATGLPGFAFFGTAPTRLLPSTTRRNVHFLFR